MWVRLEKTEADSYLIDVNESPYNAYRKLFANTEKTLIVKDNLFTIVGTLTLGDFKRGVSHTLDNEEIKSSAASLAEICCKNYYSLEYQNDVKINCDHLLVPLYCDDEFAGVLRRRGPHRNLEIGNVAVGDGVPPILIAEIGVNHDGDMAKARLLIDQAKKANADFVKFQHRSLVDTYIEFEGNNASELSTESTLDHLRKVNFSIKQLNELFEHARSAGIPPLCTPFDMVSLDEVLSLDPVALKIASADLLNFDLIEAAAKTHLPLILSTGMHTEDEIVAAVNFVRLHTADFIILHCVSSYPAESSSLNLIYIQRLKELCGCIVGYSSHDNGNLASLSSVALGAAVVEKHLTWSRQADGPDHNASIEFPELQSLSKQIKEVYTSVGNLKAEGKKLSQGELMNRANLSKGLYATRLIKAGEVLTNDDLICRSPGIGIPCSSKKFALGRPVLRKINKFEPVYESDIFPKNVYWDRLQNIPINSTWGIPVRFRDVNAAVETFAPEFVEFHLTYSDLYFKDFDTLDVKNCGVKVHTPELFEENFLLDLASLERPVRDKSIEYMKKTIEISHNIFNESNQSTPLDLVINVGGHSSDFFLDADIQGKLFDNLLVTFEKIDFGVCNPLIQSMPPFPWHLGGRRYHNLFVKESDFLAWNKETDLKFCIDFSHSFLAAKFLDKPFFEYLEKILPFSSYFHVADSEGLDGEGLQILEGEIDFKSLYETFLSSKKIEYIPEIWNGHIDAFQPFKTALFRLRNLGW